MKMYKVFEEGNLIRISVKKYRVMRVSDPNEAEVDVTVCGCEDLIREEAVRLHRMMSIAWNDEGYEYKIEEVEPNPVIGVGDTVVRTGGDGPKGSTDFFFNGYQYDVRLVLDKAGIIYLEGEDQAYDISKFEKVRTLRDE